MFLKKVVIAVFVGGLVFAVSGSSTLQTFTSPDGSFQFKYSPLLVSCKRDDPTIEGELGAWIPHPPCGFCESVDRSRSTTACFAYPESKFKDKPEFSHSEFFVAQLKEEVTEEACLKTPDWAKGNPKETNINGVTFKVLAARESTGMHSYEETKTYRVS